MLKEIVQYPLCIKGCSSSSFIDVKNPFDPKIVSWHAVPAGHTSTCINDCQYLWSVGPYSTGTPGNNPDEPRLPLIIRAMAVIERAGNALPHPFWLFWILSGILAVVSAVLAATDVSVISPADDKAVGPDDKDLLPVGEVGSTTGAPSATTPATSSSPPTPRRTACSP